MRARLVTTVRGAASIGVLLSLVIGLHALARFGLDGPASSIDSIRSWLGDPIVVAATMLRWLALAFCYYLLFVAVAMTAAPDRALDGPVGRLVPTRIVALLAVAIGVAGVVETAAPFAEPDAPAEVDRGLALSLVRAEDALSLEPIVETPTTGVDGTATVAVERDSIWIVRPGDHFWSIAEETLADAWGRTALSDAEIATYWRELVDANRDRLVEPGNPDLIWPDQEFVLPPVPDDPAGPSAT